MFKVMILVAVFLTVVDCGGCPYGLNKRQAPGQRPPNGGAPNGRAPNGRAPNSGAPNGGAPNGVAPNGGAPNGRAPNGRAPNGGAPNGGAPNGGAPNGGPPPGQKNGKDRRTRPTEAPTTRAPPVPANSCDRANRYQSFDGSCNNLINANLGKGETSFKRYIDAEYDDNSFTARKLSANGQQLPNPRVISRSFMDDNSEFESKYSDLLVYYGQFLAHDLTEIKDTQVNGLFVDCPCGSTNSLCLPFEIPSTDDKMSQSCMTFTRSQGGISTNGNGDYEQTNFLSSFVDGTQVYGSSETISNELRSFVKGQMRVSEGDYLPLSETDFSCSANFDLQCFIGGEPRPSENLALTGVHTLHVREHNRIANELASLNPSWNDDTLYNEARKILQGMIQHIVYNEWLPAVIGNKDELRPLTSGYFNGYNSSVNPSISNEFAVSAFRFGHTLIRNNLDRYNLLNQVVGNVNLSSIIFDSTEAYTNLGVGGLESIFMGLLSQPTAKFDASIVDTLQNHLFEFGGIALDLPAININRARDHGVPGYTKFRELCGGKSITSFDQLSNVMSAANINKLRGVYSSVDDVDLFVGGLLETPENGVVGSTVGCLIRKQFYDLKAGDRFYYENGPSATAFAIDQLSEIRKASISGMICNNLGPRNIQPKGFKMPDNTNQRTDCRRISQVNLAKWKV